jgi:hypothetical protein
MKIGILASSHEVPRIQSLLRYLEGKAEVHLHVDELCLIDSGATAFDDQVVFTKGKGYALLTMARIAEASGIPVVNSAHAIWVAAHRLLASIACRQAGVRVPEFSVGTSAPDAFGKVIVKNLVDQNHLRFLDILPIVGGPRSQIPPITTAEEAGISELVPHYHFYQRFLHTKFEYKVYGFGEKLLYYRQLPVLVNPDKMSTRVQIDEVPELRHAAQSAMRATGLKIASLDFLEERGEFYLTDVNSTPNFNYIAEGAKIVGDYLLAIARDGGHQVAMGREPAPRRQT